MNSSKEEHDWNKKLNSYDIHVDNEYVEGISHYIGDVMYGAAYHFKIVYKQLGKTYEFTDAFYLGTRENCFDESFRYFWNSCPSRGTFCLDLKEGLIYRAFSKNYDPICDKKLTQSVITKGKSKYFLSHHCEEIEHKSKLFSFYRDALV